MGTYANVVGRLSRAADRLAISANVLGALVVLFLIVVINLDVFMRTVLLSPIRGAVEIVEISIVAIVFLQLADVVRTGRLTRSDAFLERITGANPTIGFSMRRFFDLLSATFMALIIYALAPEVIEAYEQGAYVGTEGVFTAPEWPIIAVMVLGAILCLFRWLLSAIAPVYKIARPDDHQSNAKSAEREA